MKICTKCKEEKEFIEFYKKKDSKCGYDSLCIVCKKIYYQVNKKSIILYKSIRYANKKDELIKIQKIYNSKFEVKNKRKEYSKNYYIENKEYFLNYIQNNKIEFKKYQKEYNSRPEVIQQRNIKQRERYQNDIQYRLRCIYRARIYQAFKEQGLRKPNKSIRLLDISSQDYQIFLESQFLPPFDWNNQDKVWEIDHIKSISSFDLRDLEQVKECFHYSNTRPIFKTTEIAISYGYTDQIGNRDRKKLKIH